MNVVVPMSQRLLRLLEMTFQLLPSVAACSCGAATKQQDGNSVLLFQTTLFESSSKKSRAKPNGKWTQKNGMGMERLVSMRGQHGRPTRSADTAAKHMYMFGHNLSLKGHATVGLLSLLLKAPSPILAPPPPPSFLPSFPSLPFPSLPSPSLPFPSFLLPCFF